MVGITSTIRAESCVVKLKSMVDEKTKEKVIYANSVEQHMIFDFVISRLESIVNNSRPIMNKYHVRISITEENGKPVMYHDKETYKSAFLEMTKFSRALEEITYTFNELKNYRAAYLPPKLIPTSGRDYEVNAGILDVWLEI